MTKGSGPVSSLIEFIERWIIRVEVREATVHHVMRKAPAPSAGTILVTTSMGTTRSLNFKKMYILDKEAALHKDPLLYELIEAGWPHEAGGRQLHPFKDGLSLCDMAQYLRSEDYAVSLLQLGQIAGWWRMVYDEHIACSHSEANACPEFCTVYIDQMNQPPRRPRKKREPLNLKLKLPELAPPRSIAPGW